LRELQDAELELRRLEQGKASHDRAAKVRGEQIARQKEHIELLRGRQRQARMAADKKELDVKQKRAEIEKLRHQQTQVRDNRQFAVLQNEMKFAELSISKLEDEILADLGDMEAIENDTRQAQADLQHQQQEYQAAIREIEARKGDVDARIAEGRRRRDAIAATLPPRVVDLFNRIADRSDGEALAPVIREEDDEDGGYVCGGCHMSVTRNTYVKLRSRSTEDLCTCPNCTRILYLEET
jgi:predicted  nucleic acid-binding Zn-ribbon protein